MKKYWLRPSLALTVLGGIILAGHTATALAQQESTAPKERVMIVLDASGSMLARIGDEQKISIARSALNDLLNDWDSDIEVGLMAYGHRQKGECDDIEVLVPVGKFDKSRIMDAANKITPLGKTPLSAATIQAAEELKYSEEKATVILLSDGEETCENDPCEVGKALEDQGIGFTAHVIGFDVSNPDHVAQLKCLAENTGGKYFNAQDATELKDALVSAVKEVKADAEPETETSADNFKLSAVYSEGGDQVDRGITWEVLPAKDSTLNQNSKALFRGYKAVEHPKLESDGNYIVRAKVGWVTVETPWDTIKDSRELEINLNAGMLEAEATATEGGDPLTKDIAWEVRSKDQKSERPSTDYNAHLKALIPAGEHVVKAKWGTATAEETVTVTAGQTEKVTLNLSAGVLAPSALYSSEGDAVEKDTRWQVLASKTSISGDRKAFASNYDAKPTFRLAAGEYMLQLTVGSAVVSETVTVEADSQVTPELILNAGIAVIEHKNFPSGATIEVFDAKTSIDGKRKSHGRVYNAKYQKVLPEGDYIVAVTINKETQETPVSVKAGERAEVILGE